MRIFICCCLLVFSAVSPAHALQADVVGHIQTLQGTAVIVRGGNSLPVTIGTTLSRGDLVRTGKPGAVGIVLTDNTTISLGPNSELALKDYVFAPKDGTFALVVRMVKGTFVYLSGLMGKLAPDKVQLLTPDATIGLRGTKLLVEVRE